jgi:hypothetical protein
MYCVLFRELSFLLDLSFGISAALSSIVFLWPTGLVKVCPWNKLVKE